MSNVEKWSAVANNNVDAVPDGAPEGHPRSSVNNIMREAMAAVRHQWESMAWFDKTKGPSTNGFTLARLTDTQVTLVHETTPTDARGKFEIGARIRVGDSSTYVYGFVSAKAYASPTTTITIDMDGSSVVQATPTVLELHVTDGTVGRTAFSPRGTTLAQDPPEVPAIDDLGDGATIDQGSGNGFDADTVDGFHAASLIAASLGGGVQLVNGNFAVGQRGLSLDPSTYFPTDNGAYVADQWALLTGKLATRPGAGSGVVDIDLVDAVGTQGTPCSTSIRITGNGNLGSSPVEKVGLIQWLPNDACRHLNSGEISVSAYVKKPGGSGFDSFRIAVVQWSGTADALTATDPIDNWGDVGVLPTVLADYSIDVGDVNLVGTSWTEYNLQGVAIAADTTNIGVLLYMDDTSVASGDIVEMTGVAIAQGGSATSYVQEDFTNNFHRCRRFFCTTFDHGMTAKPKSAEANVLDAAIWSRSRPASGRAFENWDFGTSMLKIPTLTTLNPSSSGTADTSAWNITTSSDVTFDAASTHATKRGAFFTIDEGGWFDDEIAWHACAEAVL